MSTKIKTGLFAAAVAVIAGVGPALAADLGGSVKDEGYIPHAMHASAGPCYWRADTGYGWTTSPTVKWTVPGGNTDRVTNVTTGNTWFAETGLGCGSGSRGLRGEVVFGYRDAFNIKGDPAIPNDPLHTNVQSYTGMFNAYYDLGRFSGIVPYVGVGLGAAYNTMDEVRFTGVPGGPNRLEGGSKLGLAWSVMAGIGYQISDRAILDLGYRYIDLGSVNSGRVDACNCVFAPVRVTDLGAHEVKIGLRFHFGGAAPMPVSYK